MIINCLNKENLNSLVNILGVKLSNKCKIEKEQINKPKLKVIDIDMDNADDNEIELVSCRVFDLINTAPCNKCARFGHSSKKCENSATCNKCADVHLPSECTSSTKYMQIVSTKYNTKYDINHSAIDSELCEILKFKIKKYIEMTNYPTNPTYPRFFGTVESLHFQRTGLIRRARFASTDSTASPNSRNTGTPSSLRNAVSTKLINQNG